MGNKLYLENGAVYELSADELRVMVLSLKLFECADMLAFSGENKTEDYKVALKNLLAVFEHIDF